MTTTTTSPTTSAQRKRPSSNRAEARTGRPPCGPSAQRKRPCRRRGSRRSEVRQFILDHRPIFARQGSVVTDWRRRGERRYGPYYRLTWREEGRQRSLYLGTSANLAEAIREVLREVQRKWHLRRTLRRLMARAKASLREHRRRSGPGLANYGMYWKGNELRGWANYRAGGWRGHFFEDLKAGRIVPPQAQRLSPAARALVFPQITLPDEFVVPASAGMERRNTLQFRLKAVLRTATEGVTRAKPHEAPRIPPRPLAADAARINKLSVPPEFEMPCVTQHPLAAVAARIDTLSVPPKYTPPRQRCRSPPNQPAQLASPAFGRLGWWV